MRIISGHARRIQLQTPAGRDLRPTSDRVKETLFAMLEPLAELRVLDLFAGTGALGLEALSRGAADVVFVEHNSRHVRLIEENLAAVRKAFGLLVDRKSILEFVYGRLATPAPNLL